MGVIILCLVIFLLICLVGLFVWWVGNKIYLSIKRDNSVYDIEEAAHKKAKRMVEEEGEKEYENKE